MLFYLFIYVSGSRRAPRGKRLWGTPPHYVILYNIVSFYVVFFHGYLGSSERMVQQDKVHGPNGRLVDAAPPATDERHYRILYNSMLHCIISYETHIIVYCNILY